MKKLGKILVTALISALALTGCGQGSSGSDGGKIARIKSGGEPGSLHPALSQGTHESIILDHVFEGLMKRDENLEITPGMAESYTMSEDGLTYTFKLRDAKWSNGEAVTAEDFEFAWKYALDPASASEYAYQLYYLEGGQAFNEGTGSMDDVGVKALDSKTLEVKLAAPTPFFIELCAFYTYYPVNKKLQESNPEWANDGKTFVCNGPFTVTNWAHDSSVTLKKNKNYYNAQAIKLDGIEFIISEDLNTLWQMYEADELDVAYDLQPDVLGKLREEKNPELITEAELAMYFYRFNTTVKPFNNVKVRKALTMAINRQELIDSVVQGGQFPAFALVPGGISTADGDFRAQGGDYFKEDIEEAKRLLAEGLKEEGMESLSFTILYNTSEAHKKIAEAIQQIWKQNLDVDVQLENTEFQVKIDREDALDYEVSRAGWIGDYLDPNTFLDMFTSWSSQNETGWTSEKYDELIAAAGKEFDATKRMNYLHEAETLIMEDMPVMPIYFYTSNVVVKPYMKNVLKAANRDVCLIYADIVK